MTAKPPTHQTVLGALEHTLLAPTATPTQIDALCDEAAAHGLFGVCVHPMFVARCRARLAGAPVRIVTVVGFPLASSFNEAIELECQLALQAGADEIDGVMRLSAAKSGDWSTVEADAARIVRAAAGAPVKLILETALLSDAEIDRACAVALAAGVQFVKTSTGFASGGATPEAVGVMRRAVGGRAGVKASGGIRDLATACAML